MWTFVAMSHGSALNYAFGLLDGTRKALDYIALGVEREVAVPLDLAALLKDLSSSVAGHADILIVPNLEAGNMLAKQLIYLAGGDAAGLVLGAGVPIILASRVDSLQVRLASVVLAKFVAARMAARAYVG